VTMSATPLEVLAGELGAVAARIERESVLRLDAAFADLRRVDAERELRLTALERRVDGRIATIKDGTPGASVTVDDVRPVLVSLVAEAVSAFPVPVDGKSVTLEDVAPLVASEVARAVAALPPAEKGDKGEPGEPGQPGEAGAGVTLEDVAPLVASEIARAVAALPPAEKGDKGEPGEPGQPGEAGAGVTLDDVAPLVASEVARAVAALPPAAKGDKGEPGEPGKPGEAGREGLMPIAKEWTDKVHYAGVVVTYGGATYQAHRDTGREPPHEDWICLAAAGRDGKDGRSPKVRGTFSHDVHDYSDLDIVALGGAAFIARHDNPGPCPGPGWQLISSQGKRGNIGERGPRGPAGPTIARMDVDDQGMLTLFNADGSKVECDLYPLLAKLQ